MNAEIIGHVSAPELITLVAHWVALWLGLSLLIRRPRSAASALAAGAFLVVSAYLLSVVFLLTPESGRADVFWDRWLGGWEFLAPALLLHAFLSLTGTRLPRQRLVLTLAYVAAASVTAMSMWSGLIFTYQIPAGGGPDAKGVFIPGPLQFIQVLQSLGTFALALVVLLRARRVAPAAVRSQLTLMIAGGGLALFAGALMFASSYVGSLRDESLLQPLVVLGGVLVAVPFVRYRGLLEGQLLRSDLKSSLLATALLMGVYLILMVAAGASEQLVAGLGWFVLAAFVLSDDLRAIADRAFYGAGSRAGRAGLRTAASYAGAGETIDVANLAPGQPAELVEYLGALDRAALVTARLEGPRAQRLELLAREEFASVRDALGLPAGWEPVDGLSAEVVTGRVAQRLEPRERQALGLKYLGYSDKQMAQLMGVKANVPRSYLGAAKRKLGLSAGAPLMLFVYLAGLVDSDALPLLAIPAAGSASSGVATQNPPGASVQDLS
jgi:hypothetical protein